MCCVFLRSYQFWLSPFLIQQVFEDGLGGGEGSIFFFALFCFVLAILYTILNFKTMGSSARAQVDNSALI
jgi:hypothetical protein